MPPIVAALSTIPERRAHLARVMSSLLPQVDQLWVFFDRCTPTDRALAIATFAGEPRFVSWDPGTFAVGDAAKFRPLPWTDSPAHTHRELVYLTCDDDFVYPPDYAARMAAAVARAPHAVHTLHGGVLRGRVESWRGAIRADRMGYHAAHVRAHSDGEYACNVPGTGALAARLDVLRGFACPPQPQNVADLHLAVWLQQQRTPVRTVAHAADWLTYVLEPDQPTLWATGNPSDTSAAAQQRRRDEDSVVQQVTAWEVF